MKQEIDIVWLKRDLRLQDNEALSNACKSGNRFLICYFFEPSIAQDPHYSQRHFNFIKQSLQDINEQLISFNSKVLIVHSEVLQAFKKIQDSYVINTVYSHQETGLLITYERDKEFNRFCRNNLINWKENINNGVYRGLKNREQWFERWTSYMSQNQVSFQPGKKQLLSQNEIEQLESKFKLPNLDIPDSNPFQKGGTKIALKYASTFFDQRHT